MTKDELKNRISMALKDPILQQGFEIICKENVELEESNKEWQRTCEAKSDTNSQLAEQLADKVEKIAELEKKNAELNKNLSKEEAEYDEMFWQKNETISKAKDLINRLIHILVLSNTPYERYEEIQKQAEQFLNGECCPDCLCEDCTKDCEIKKLGLVEVSE